jgi:arginine-tRNA-protein transferase
LNFDQGNYRPSFLLCPETYTFQPIASCLPKLDHSKYSRFCDDLKVTDVVGNFKLDQVLIMFKDKIYYLGDYLPLSAKDRRLKKFDTKEMNQIKEFALLVGSDGLNEIVFWKSNL